MSYFEQLPDLNYPFLTDNDSLVVKRVKNLFRRAKIRDDIFDNIMYFDRYKVFGDDRPDNVAEKIYGNSDLDWVVLLSNNITNVYEEWPLDTLSFQNYVNAKYTYEEQYQIKHYVTTELRDSSNSLVRPEGIIVTTESYQDYTFKYFDPELSNVVTLGNQTLSEVTNIDYEIEKNDAKRNIFLVKKNLIEIILKDMKEIMEYAESSQTKNKRLK